MYFKKINTVRKDLDDNPSSKRDLDEDQPNGKTRMTKRDLDDNPAKWKSKNDKERSRGRPGLMENKRF